MRIEKIHPGVYLTKRLDKSSCIFRREEAERVNLGETISASPDFEGGILTIFKVSMVMYDSASLLGFSR